MACNIKCLDLLKRCFFVAMTVLSLHPLNANSLECVALNNQNCKVRAKLRDSNNNELVFYPFSIKVNKCSESSMIYMLNCVFLMLLKT